MIFHFSVSRIHLYKSLGGKPHCLIRKPHQARISSLQGREEVSINNEMCLCWRRTCQVKQEWLCNIQAMFALPVPVSRAGETSETWCSHTAGGVVPVCLQGLHLWALPQHILCRESLTGLIVIICFGTRCHYVAPAGPRLRFLLLHPPRCSDYRPVSRCPAF